MDNLFHFQTVFVLRMCCEKVETTNEKANMYFILNTYIKFFMALDLYVYTVQ